MKYLIFCTMIGMAITQCTSNVFAAECTDVRRKILAQAVMDAHDYEFDQEHILNDIREFYKSPKQWTNIMCGDVYGEGDPGQPGFDLCEQELKVCK